MTGPLYERDMGKLPGTQKAHTIPSAYWKVIFINNSPAVNHYAAFLFDQNTPKGADFCQFRVTVDEIEKRTGLIIWAGLPDDAGFAEEQARRPAGVDGLQKLTKKPAEAGLFSSGRRRFIPSAPFARRPTPAAGATPPRDRAPIACIPSAARTT